MSEDPRWPDQACDVVRAAERGADAHELMAFSQASLEDALEVIAELLTPPSVRWPDQRNLPAARGEIRAALHRSTR